MDISRILLAALASSVVWFIAGSILYMNPWVSKIYEKARNLPGMKKWSSNGKFLINMFFMGMLFQCLLFALVYSLIKPVLPGTVPLNTAFFGLIMIALKIFPRWADMWLLTSYPDKLLITEFINGSIGAFIVAYILVLVI